MAPSRSLRERAFLVWWSSATTGRERGWWLARQGQFGNGHGAGAAGDDRGTAVREVHAVDEAQTTDACLHTFRPGLHARADRGTAGLPDEVKRQSLGRFFDHTTDRGIHGRGAETAARQTPPDGFRQIQSASVRPRLIVRGQKRHRALAFAADSPSPRCGPLETNAQTGNPAQINPTRFANNRLVMPGNEFVLEWRWNAHLRGLVEHRPAGKSAYASNQFRPKAARMRRAFHRS